MGQVQAHRKDAAGPGRTPRNILLQAEGRLPGPAVEDLPGLVDGVSDASDAAGLVDHGEEGALGWCELALVLRLDGDEHGDPEAHHLRRDGDRVEAEGVAGAAEHLAGVAAEAIGHEPAGAVEEATDVVAPEACGAAAEGVDDGAEDGRCLIGAAALATGPTNPLRDASSFRGVRRGVVLRHGVVFQ